MSIGDTIAAIATPPGTGGIGVIRVSGPRAEDIARLLFRSSHHVRDFKSRRLYHGDIVAAGQSTVIDEVLIVLMRKPNSYTGEDTLEIYCHGGLLIMESILGEVARAGVRLAEPGEFTKRAFLNNRIDLSQAEATADMIAARTRRGLDLALSHLKGNLARKIEALHSPLLDILAALEVSIDFTEEELGEASPPAAYDALEAVVADIERLLATSPEGIICRQGASVVIAGRPNVGKSSLLNRLLGEQRAIVTPIPGTTRDFIEETVDIRGVPVRLMDTAGIRHPENIIEAEGIRRVWQKSEGADVVMVLLDGSEPLRDEDTEILEGNRTRPVLVVVNKVDLAPGLDGDVLRSHMSGEASGPLWISAKFGQGIDELIEVLGCLLLHDQAEREPEVRIANIRHQAALEEALRSIRQAQSSIREGHSPEFVAFDIQQAIAGLDLITGRSVDEQVLDRIFSTFCIGK
ncbi:MAG: tRNA uridine-5-carboxymethylaminomethyl(34) synthesis GTPase MnmE [Deltaproteobacteria bacterium]|nr:tRNA uridine-5-carboxymethylaminomethyl(34) synthesis GTPase MnmE [Deltaproteobacteria bacterium]